MWIVTATLGCRHEATDPQHTAPEAVDLVSPLGAGEVRAGRITDEAALFGGISAEGRAGDLKLYNDRVQFVIQDARPGSYYLLEGGGVIDADVVRPDGVVGRDVVEEWAAMFGLGRVMIPETVEVISDGSDGAAIVRVSGYEGPLGLIEGALEAPGFVPSLGLEMTTEYRLAPDSWLLEVTSTATATTDPASIAVGDLLMGADELVTPWIPGAGMAAGDSAPRAWSGYVGDRNDVATLLAAPPGGQLEVGGADLLTELASMVVGFGPTTALEPGDSVTWTRYYGVGPDLATLSAAVLATHGVETQTVSGTVTAPDGPVPGARVVIDTDGAPYTVAITGPDGSFETAVPAGAAVSLLADGRGPGLSTDLPAGAASVSPYSAAPIREQGLAALAGGATEVPLAVGRGIGSPADPLELGLPATLAVESDDGLPFTVRVSFVDPDPPTDNARIVSRPDGLAAAGWSRDGGIELPVEPGTYDVLVHRGPRYELHTQRVTLTGGERTEISASLPAAFSHPGWVLGDPHSHASPSSDGALPMEDRLVVTGAVGVQVHFGTDHDHLADYRPLLDPLGLQGVVRSVVADEVSPPTRGHFNIYPVEPDETLPDNGAWLWWEEIPQSTEAVVDALRARHGDKFVLQSNHPTESGVARSAGWSEGRVARGDYWTDRLEAVEVLNSGDHDSFVPFWMDLVGRGYLTTPIGVSDSHSHFGGHVGWSATWMHVGSDDVSSVTDDTIADTIRGGQVVPMRGPFLEVAPLPGATVASGTALTVSVRTASWVKVDRIRLLRNGVEVEAVDGTEASFALADEQDAWYLVIAEGDQPMLPVTGDTPWALAGPWLLDADGDGWTPPLPPLEVP